MLQVTLQQHLQTLEDVTKERDDNVNNLDKTKSKLEEATTKLDRQQIELDQSNQRYQELSTNLQHTKESLDKEVGKWKMLYDSLYNQYDNELHTWEENLVGETEKYKCYSGTNPICLIVISQWDTHIMRYF